MKLSKEQIIQDQAESVSSVLISSFDRIDDALYAFVNFYIPDTYYKREVLCRAEKLVKNHFSQKNNEVFSN